ncbi:MAG: alpha/beta hydrolase [Desulfobacter sp.]|nr:alpha/beta hydrolase [Desulfobacter sp.]
MITIDTQFNADTLVLKGKLHLPDTPNPPLVVGSHGLEGTMNSAKQQVLAKILPENGMAFFRFDHRGCGQSQGDFVKDTSLDLRTRDLAAAVDHLMGLGLTSNHLALFGSSIGGATCINSWETLELMGRPPMGGVLCASPVKSQTIKNIPTQANGNRPALPMAFFEKNLLFDILGKAKHLHHVMIFHGDKDEIVPISNAQDLFNTMQSPKERIIHKNGTHQMTHPSDQADFEVRALAWYQQIFSL